MDTIIVETPSSVTTSNTITFTKIEVVKIEFDLPEDRVVIGVNKTATDGRIFTESITLTGADCDNFLSALPAANDTLGTLGVNTSIAAVKTFYGITS